MDGNGNTLHCDVCKVKDLSLQYMTCEFCEALSHVKCLNFGDKEYRIWSTKDAMCFVCDECRKSPQLKQFKELRKQNDVLEKFIYKIDERMQSQSVDINTIGNGTSLGNDNIKAVLNKVTDLGKTMSESLKELKQCVITAVGENHLCKSPRVENSYSSALKSTTVGSKSVCVIKPKNDKQDRHTTKKKVMKEIDPINISVSGMRGVSGGGVAILCDTTEALNGVKEIAEKKLGDFYDVSIPKPRNPRIKLSGLSEKPTDDDLKRMLIAQNDLVYGEGDIRVISILSTRRGIFFDAIIEVPPQLYNDLLQRERVKVGWSMCYVADGVNVRRCIKCCSYGHLARNCKSECFCCCWCAGDHDSRTCENKNNSAMHACVNCKRANEKYAFKMSANHPASSKECRVYLRELSLLREKLTFV